MAKRYDDDDYDRDDDDLDIRKSRRGGDGENIPNYLTQAVLVTLFCCLPLGVVAIVKANEVTTALAKGDYDKAQAASDEAKKYCWIGFVGGLIAGPILFAVQVMGAR